MASSNTSPLLNKKVLLGICGGIAAYKTPELVRRLVEQGAVVKVVMTAAAQSFVTPLTLQAVSGHPVHDDLLDPNAEAAMGHIELARWADLIVIAPTTADLMAKANAGFANDLLTTLLLATRSPIALAPAMNQAMWQNSATQCNLKSLRARSFEIWGPDSGQQACGEIGPGRMLGPDQIVERVVQHFNSYFGKQRKDSYAQNGVLVGKNIVITAGPTREPLDPVRYISNHSSGKMGFAIAAAAANAGANVTLVAGPVTLNTPHAVQRIDVSSAQEMLDAVNELKNQTDVFIATAAVADYRAAAMNEQKIKKDAESMQINLVKNPDILAHVSQWQPKPFCVGFAAETQNVVEYANRKLQKKNLDMIAANDVSKSDIGFNSDENALTVIWPEGNKNLARASKPVIASSLMELIAIRMGG